MKRADKRIYYQHLTAYERLKGNGTYESMPCALVPYALTSRVRRIMNGYIVKRKYKRWSKAHSD